MGEGGAGANAGDRLRGARGVPTVQVVFLAWDPTRSSTALDSLRRRIATSHDVEYRVQRVINGPAMSPLDGVDDVEGDNSAREFSGWQRGVEAVAKAPDVWLFANDRFPEYSYPYLELLGRRLVETTSTSNAIVGKIDRYPKRTESFGRDVSAWVTTCFFLLPDTLLKTLQGVITISDQRWLEMFKGVPDADTEWIPRAAGDRHRQYLLEWLRGRPGALRESWYGHDDVDSQATPAFRAKLLSILNEQLLSARARQAGGSLMPMRWAASHLGPAWSTLARARPGLPLALERISSRVA